MSADRKALALRLSSDIADALTRWADDDLRSLNAQIEYLLREALRKNGRLGGKLAEVSISDPTSVRAKK